MTILHELKLKKVPIEQVQLWANAASTKKVFLEATKTADSVWAMLVELVGYSLVLVVTVSEFDLKPKAYLRGLEDIIVGAGEKLFLVKNCTIRKMVRLPCRFYEVIFSEKELFIAQNEIGFSCFDYSLNRAWEWSGDLVARWEIKEGRLAFETLEGAVHNIVIYERGQRGD